MSFGWKHGKDGRTIFSDSYLPDKVARSPTQWRRRSSILNDIQDLHPFYMFITYHPVVTSAPGQWGPAAGWVVGKHRQQSTFIIPCPVPIPLGPRATSAFASGGFPTGVSKSNLNV